MDRRAIVTMSLRPKFWFVALWCIMFISGCGASSEPKKRGALDREFLAEFGFQPPPTIQDLRCKVVRVGDTWGKWLLFTLDEATLQRVISNGFTAASPDAQRNSSAALWSQDLVRTNPNAPSWWRSPGTNQVRVYYRESHPRDFAGFTYFWVDENNRTVYAESAAWH